MTDPRVKRLRDVGSGAGPEGQLGRVVRAMRSPAPLSREARGRILRVLRRPDGERSSWPRRVLTVAAAAAALLLFAAGARALVARVVASREAGKVEPSTERTRAARRPPVAQREDLGESPEPTAAPAPPAPVVKTVAPQHPIAAEPVSSVGEESRMLARAIQKLRQEHDARGALIVLDRYRVRFPEGVLRAEATLVRLDALTTLGDARSALATLDQLDISGARAAELWVTRGELRAREGRCREAMSDFDRALAQAPGRAGDRWNERALRGRAACRQQLGLE